MGLFGTRRGDRGADPAAGKAKAGDGWQQPEDPSHAAHPVTPGDRGRDPAAPASGPNAVARAAARAERERTAGPGRDTRRRERDVARVGQSIVFEGKLRGQEDLEVAGSVAGDVSLPDHQLTVAEGGRVEATISARRVLVAGRVVGDVEASERVEVSSTGVVQGDLRAPRLVIAEGAVINGRIDMQADGARPHVGTEKSADGDAAV